MGETASPSSISLGRTCDNGDGCVHHPHHAKTATVEVVMVVVIAEVVEAPT